MQYSYLATTILNTCCLVMTFPFHCFVPSSDTPALFSSFPLRHPHPSKLKLVILRLSGLLFRTLSRCRHGKVGQDFGTTGCAVLCQIQTSHGSTQKCMDCRRQSAYQLLGPTKVRHGGPIDSVCAKQGQRSGCKLGNATGSYSPTRLFRRRHGRLRATSSNNGCWDPTGVANRRTATPADPRCHTTATSSHTKCPGGRHTTSSPDSRTHHGFGHAGSLHSHTQ